MKLLSSKKNHPSSAASAVTKPSSRSNASTHSTAGKPMSQDPPLTFGTSNNANSNNPSIIPASLIQLQLENADLRTQLTTLTTSDESKAELLTLLQESTHQNELLTEKIHALNAGFIEIDKERLRLRKSADQSHGDRMEMEKKAGELERCLKMREKEVDILSERVREQERRLECVTAESLEGKRVVEGLEREVQVMEELRHELEGVVRERDGLRGEGERLGLELEELALLAEEKTRELDELRVVEEGLNRKLEGLKVQLKQSEGERVAEGEKWSLRVEEMNSELQEKIGRVEELTTDLERQLELERNLTMQLENAQAHAVELEERLQMEKTSAMNDMQSDIDAKVSIIQTLEEESTTLHEEIKGLKSTHEQKMTELEGQIQQYKDDNASLEQRYNQQVETTTALEATLEKERQSHLETETKLTAANGQLQSENEELAEELIGTKDELAKALSDAAVMQQQCGILQNDNDTLKEGQSQLQQEVDDLHVQLETSNADHNKQLYQQSKRVSTLENEVSQEKSTSNDLRSKLRELNLQLKESSASRTEEIGRLEQSLEIAQNKLCEKDLELGNFRARYQNEVKQHNTEMQSLRKEHESQMIDMETRGADVVSDLEDTELLVRQMEEREKKTKAQEEKMRALASVGKQRGDEVMELQNELANVRNALQSSARESEDALQSLQHELDDTRAAHEREMSEWQHIVNDVRSQLDAAKKRLANEDGELNVVKSKLTERTNLLRDMVNQTKGYQGDFEREHNRANQLSEAVTTYKAQLAEARQVAQRLEEEIHEKETQYFEAIRIERSQRKLSDSKLESSLQSVEEIIRRNNEMEKENTALKDKITRQENYIGRLQDREKQQRDVRRGPLTAKGGNSRHSTGDGGSRESFRSTSPMRPAARNALLKATTTDGVKHIRTSSVSSYYDENIQVQQD
eukprot:g13419.t1 g13419   contig8:643020-645891(+)